MTLAEFEDDTDQSDVDVGELCGVAASTINRLRRKRMRASVELSLQIERGTKGRVRAEDLPLTRRTRLSLATLRGQLSETAA